MFSGIIRELGVVEQIVSTPKFQLTIYAPRTCTSLILGSSVAVDGCCLTVTSLNQERFTVDLVPETLSKTNLSGTSVGSKLNLETSLQFGAYVDGHIVQGHIDTVGIVDKIERYPDSSWKLWISIPEEFSAYLAPKGSVAINGVSLTIVDSISGCFSFCMIPHTAQETNLSLLHIGDKVNIEADILAKYLEQLVKYRGSNKKS